MHRSLILLLAFLLLPALAHSQAPVNPFPSCQPVIEAKCSVNAEGQPLKEAREIFGCLRKNDAELPDACRTDIERFVQAGRQAAARGGGALGSFGGLTPFTLPVPIASFEGRYSLVDEKRSETRASLSSPVYGSERGLASASLSAGQIHFENEATLTSGVRIRDLYRAEVGVQYSMRLKEKRTLGFRATVGSTGDHVFKYANDMNFSFAASYGFPGSGTDYWVVLAFIANNSPLGNYIPLPGLIYVHRTEHFTGVFGFPVISLTWTPTPLWSASASVFGPLLTTEVAYGAVETLQVFTQGSFSQQTFILHERVRERDRLTLQEKRALIGVRAPLFKASYGELQVGHALDRSAYIGEKIFRTDGGLRDFAPSAFVNVSYKHVF